MGCGVSGGEASVIVRDGANLRKRKQAAGLCVCELTSHNMCYRYYIMRRGALSTGVHMRVDNRGRGAGGELVGWELPGVRV